MRIAEIAKRSFFTIIFAIFRSFSRFLRSFLRFFAIRNVNYIFQPSLYKSHTPWFPGMIIQRHINFSDITKLMEKVLELFFRCIIVIPGHHNGMKFFWRWNVGSSLSSRWTVVVASSVARLFSRTFSLLNWRSFSASIAGSRSGHVFFLKKGRNFFFWFSLAQFFFDFF